MADTMMMHDDPEQARRMRRIERVDQNAREIESWSSHRLRLNYAQPATVRAAEERERQVREAEVTRESSGKT